MSSSSSPSEKKYAQHQESYGSISITEEQHPQNEIASRTSHNKNQNGETKMPYIAKIVILYTSSNLLALALYWSSVVVPLAYQLFGQSNLIVGLLSCVYGMMNLVAAFTSGHFTDKNQKLRPRVLLVGAAVGFIGIVMMAVAVSFDWYHFREMVPILPPTNGTNTGNINISKSDDDKYLNFRDDFGEWFLNNNNNNNNNNSNSNGEESEPDYAKRRRITLPMWIIACSTIGLYQGLTGANVEATIAAVIPKGKRDKIYATKVICEALSGIAGCVCGLVLFLSCGNSWSIRAMSIVVLLGLGVHLCVLGILVYLSKISSAWMDENYEGVVLAAQREQEKKERESLLKSKAKEKDEDDKNENASCCCCSKVFSGPFQATKTALPFFVSTQDLIVVLGSGMTVRFFFLFLINDYNCSPVLLIGVSFLQIVLQAVFVKLQVLLTSKFFTRIQGILLARFIGPFCILYMSLPPLYESPIWGALVPTLIAYILRQPIMNCTSALSRSLIMDAVPMGQRARWNAAESLVGASWSGSALLGGYLSDLYGYRSTFLLTVGFHATSFIVLSLVFRTKEMREDEAGKEESGGEEEEDEEKNNDDHTSRFFRPTNDRVSGINDDDDDEKEQENAPLL